MRFEYLGAAHQRLVRIETIICTCLNGLLPSAAMFFLYDQLPISLLGATGLAVLTTKNTLASVLLMTTIMTLVTRRKMLLQQLPALETRRRNLRWQRFVPDTLVLRVPLFAALAWACVVPLALSVTGLLGVAPLDRKALLVFNIIVGATVGFLMTPLIQVSALLDCPQP